jgi:PAS domain S-box-containing protein
MKELKIIHFHGWVDNALLIRESAKEFAHFYCEIKDVYELDQLQIDVFTSVAPIVLIDIDLVTSQLLKELYEITVEKSPTCFFILTNDNRTAECVKLLDLDICGYLCMDDFSAHLLEQHLGVISRNHCLKAKNIADLEKMRLLQTGLNQSSDSVMITNIDGFIEYVNEAFVKLTGYSESEVLGKKPNFLKSGVHPDDFYKELWTTIISGQQWHGEFQNLKKDGSPYWEKASISPILNRQGEIGHFIAVKENITEQKRINDALELSESLHEKAQKIASIGHWVLDTATNEIVWSDQTYIIYGKPKSFKPTIDSVMECIWPEDLPMVKAALEASIELGEDNTVIHRIAVGTNEIKYVEERWEVIKDSQGNLIQWIGTTLDRTDEQVIELNLYNKTESLKGILSSMDDLVFVLDEHGCFKEFFQPNGLSKLFLEPSEFFGKHYSEILPPEVSSRLQEKISLVARTGKIEDLEYSLPIGGKEGWFKAKISQIFNKKGQGNWFTMVSRDITQEKAALEDIVKREVEYRNIFDNIQEGYMLTDMQGEILTINPFGQKILGVETSKNIVGKNIKEFFHKAWNEVFDEEGFSESGILKEYEIELDDKEGEIRIIAFNLRLIKNENSPCLIQGTFGDVTEWVQQEKLNKATIKLYEGSKQSLDYLLKVGMNTALDLLKSDLGFIYYLDEEAKTIQLVQWSQEVKGEAVETELLKYYSFSEASNWIDTILEKKPILHNDSGDLKRKGALPCRYIDLVRDLEVPIISNGKVVALIGVGNKEQNYTEQDKQLLVSFSQTFSSLVEKMESEEEHLKMLEIFDQSQQVGRIGAWRFDIINDETWWSDIMFDIYGLKKEAGGPVENWLEFTHPDDTAGMERAFETALKSGNYKYEYRLLRPDGEVRNINSQAKVVYDTEGNPSYYVGIAQDITEISQALLQLHNKNVQFENIVDSVPGVVYCLRYPNPELLYLSDYVYKMLGYKKKYFKNNMSLELAKSLIHSDDWEEIIHQILSSKKTSKNYRLNFRMFTANDELIWVTSMGKIIKEKGGVILEGFIYDVTDRVKTEERLLSAVMQAADREKSRIAKEIHDSLQQTLTIASLNLGYLTRERGSLSEKARLKFDLGMEYLKKSLDDSREIAHRIMPKAIQDFGLILALDGMVAELNRTSSVLFIFITNMEGNRIKTSTENNLYKIVQESLNNILKYSQANNVTIQYMLLGSILQLSIEDDGIGFDVKKYENRESESFGLTSMKGRASAVGAGFYLDSSLGHGTTIMIEIPYSEELKYVEFE